MKVLHVIDSLSTGGKERRLIELIKYFKNTDYNIDNSILLLSNSIDFKEVEKLGITTYFIDRKKMSKMGFVLKFVGEIKKIHPDIIHSWTGVGSVYISIAKLFCSFKFVNGMITSSPRFNLFSKYWLHSKPTFFFSDAIVSNSMAGLQAFKAPVKKSFCIHNGFSFERIKELESKESVKKRLNIETPFVVGMVAAFSVFKDYPTYIKCANIVLCRRKDVTFLCIGSGEKDKYKQMVEENNSSKVLFLDNQTNVESIINICDIGVLSTYSEGISNSIMEFMALGKPVIATGEGGTKELIKHNISGYILEQGDYIKMAEKILELIEDPSKSQRMGDESHRIIKKNFDIEKMGNDMYNTYERLLKKT